LKAKKNTVQEAEINGGYSIQARRSKQWCQPCEQITVCEIENGKKIVFVGPVQKKSVHEVHHY
jgi:hypothetical protein